jgi:hypothetical protein
VEEGGDGRREAPVSGVSADTARDTRGEAAEEGGGGATKHLDVDATRERGRERERAEWAEAGGEGWVSLGPVHGPIGLAQREFAHRGFKDSQLQ